MSLEIITGSIPPLFDYFKVIKAPPKDVLLVDIIDGLSDYKINNLYKKLFQFKYRFVYDDNEKSVWSAISKVPIPTKSTDALYNALSNVQNQILIKIPTGDLNVYKIELAGRVNIEDVWSDFFLVDTIDKKRDNVKDNIIYEYIFRNDSVYVPIDIQESNLLFDYVPDEVNALELANGNTLVVGGLKDGYDRNLPLDVVVNNAPNLNSPAQLSTLETSVRNPSNTSSFAPIEFPYGYWSNPQIAGRIVFSGTPQVGDVITIRLSGRNIDPWVDFWGGVNYNTRWFNDSWSVVFQSGWGILDLINAFINHPNNGAGGAWDITGSQEGRDAKPFGNPSPTQTPEANTLYFGTFIVQFPDIRKWIFDSATVTITRSFSFGESDVFPTYKWNGLYKFGLVYYSKDGKTNGVFTNPLMSLNTSKYKTDYFWTPDLPSTSVILPENETAQLYIGHIPPDWADYYHIVRTKELSCDFSLMAVTAGTSRNAGYLYLNIKNFEATNTKSKETSKIINYGVTSFVDGDRVRIMHKYDRAATPSPKTIWTDKDFLDLPILAVEEYSGNLSLKLKDVDLTSSPNIFNPVNGDSHVIEIYRPAKVLSDEDLVYYEVGNKYNIFTDSNGARYHDGTTVVNNIVYNTINISGVIIPGQIPFTSNTIFGIGFGLNEIEVNSRRQEITSIEDRIKPGHYIEFSNTAFNNGVYLVTNVIRNNDNKITITIDSSFKSLTYEIKQAFTIKRVSTPTASGKIAIVDMFGDGDYYYKTRTMAVDTNGNNFVSFVAADKNFSETFISAVWSQGRPLVVDENIKEEYFPAMLRFSQSYIYGTNINNLSRFYPNNFEEADASFGDILRLKTRENFIRLFQRFKVGMIPIYRQIIIDNANSSQVALSERLLNKPNYYNGEYGIDKYGSSLVSTDYGDYFIDTINKAIVRASLDGLTNISDTYNLASWANETIKEDSYGYGCFNYENRNVIMLVGHIEYFQNVQFYNLINEIVAYSESDKKFESFYGFTDAENILFANGFIYSFKEKLYIHDSQIRNNFYGVQQDAEITTVNNGGLQLKKTYNAIELLANELWTAIIKTGPLTNQETSLSSVDFSKQIGNITIPNKENKFNATIKRDELSAGGKFFGDSMKGCFAEVSLVNNTSQNTRLISVSLKYIQSPLTNS